MNKEEIEDLKEEIEDLKNELLEKQDEFCFMEEFDRESYIVAFNEFLDDGNGITICGIEFTPSKILKECDPIAYRVYFNDYVSNYEDEHNDKIEDLNKDITDLKDEIEEKEKELKELLVNLGLSE